MGSRQPGLAVNQTQNGAVNLSNNYRPDGLRYRRTDNSGLTQCLRDEDNPLAQVDALGKLVQYWSWAEGLPAFS